MKININSGDKLHIPELTCKRLAQEFDVIYNEDFGWYLQRKNTYGYVLIDDMEFVKMIRDVNKRLVRDLYKKSNGQVNMPFSTTKNLLEEAECFFRIDKNRFTDVPTFEGYPIHKDAEGIYFKGRYLTPKEAIRYNRDIWLISIPCSCRFVDTVVSSIFWDRVKAAMGDDGWDIFLITLRLSFFLHDNELKFIPMYYGKSNFGKSVICDIIVNLISGGAWKADLSSVNSRFFGSNYKNKSIILYDESPSAIRGGAIRIKNSTSGILATEEKFKKTAMIPVTWRQLIFCNDVTAMDDLDQGLDTRIKPFKLADDNIDTWKIINDTKNGTKKKEIMSGLYIRILDVEKRYVNDNEDLIMKLNQVLAELSDKNKKEFDTQLYVAGNSIYQFLTKGCFSMDTEGSSFFDSDVDNNHIDVDEKIRRTCKAEYEYWCKINNIKKIADDRSWGKYMKQFGCYQEKFKTSIVVRSSSQDPQIIRPFCWVNVIYNWDDYLALKIDKTLINTENIILF